MPTSYTFRPRSDAERLVLARILAGETLPPPADEDGWVSASRAIAGLAPPQPRLGMGEPHPLVTVLICTFNRAHLLPDAIASALAQPGAVEVVVVDDGSTDSTATLLAATPGIRVYSQPNTGKPGALALGLRHARGEAVLVLDDDDLLLPGAIDVLARALFADDQLVAVYGDTIVFDGANGRPIRYVPATRMPGEMGRRVTLMQVPAMPGATLVRMSAQIAAGDYDPRLVRGQDMDMMLRLSAIGPMGTVPLPTFLHRKHDAARGKAGAQWKKHADPAEHRARFLAYVQPVFRERWAARGDVRRDEGFAWAAGLAQRELHAEAVEELSRWPGPYSAHERWVRGELGLSAVPAVPREALVVVDDGDDGALEALLHAEGDGREVWVDLEVPRDPLGDVRLYWPGEYAARARLTQWVTTDRPWLLRLSSAPDWRPPAVLRPDLPDLPAVDALLAWAALAGLPLPRVTRPGLRWKLHPHAAACIRARDLSPGRAAAALLPVLQAHPRWRLGLRYAEQLLAADAPMRV